MAVKTKGYKVETTTHRVVKALSKIDQGDLSLLKKRTGRDQARVAVALWALRRYRVVKRRLIGGVWYYSLTPYDRRKKVIIWRKEETRPRARPSGRRNTGR